MKNSQPLVSIIIPVYNGSNFVKEAIDSALAQTYKNVEVLVINDGSCDDGKTEEIALSYGDKIRYFYKENGGVSSALNLGIREMKGEYFSWLSHDDKYTETKIEKQVNILMQFEGNDILAVCLDREIDKDANEIGITPQKAPFAAGKKINAKKQLLFLLKSKLFSGCSLLIPKNVFKAVGVFDEELRYNQDFDMWIRIALQDFSWVYSDDIGVLSRVHSAQVTQTRKDLRKHDSRVLGERIIPQFAEISTKEMNFLYLYALLSARFDNEGNLRDCLKFSKEKKLFSFGQNVALFFVGLYGKVRPLIRKIYYAVFKKVKTQ